MNYVFLISKTDIDVYQTLIGKVMNELYVQYCTIQRTRVVVSSR